MAIVARRGAPIQRIGNRVHRANERQGDGDNQQPIESPHNTSSHKKEIAILPVFHCIFYTYRDHFSTLQKLIFVKWLTKVIKAPHGVSKQWPATSRAAGHVF
jgi:hypothetical protein